MKRIKAKDIQASDTLAIITNSGFVLGEPTEIWCEDGRLYVSINLYRGIDIKSAVWTESWFRITTNLMFNPEDEVISLDDDETVDNFGMIVKCRETRKQRTK